MKQAVLAAIRTHGLWEPGHRVAVAVSGGSDSTALLELLIATAGVHGGALEVVTVDHGIHPASAGWARDVAERARAHGLSCTIASLGLGAGASEDVARTARYAVLDGLDVDRVALAHHRRDQAETVLVNLLRGTGPRGLGGMAWRRGRYVRPVLDRAPEELHAWRPEAWVDDPANADPRHLRAAVRRELLPLLEALREGSVAALARSASLAREDDALLRELAGELPLRASVLAQAPRPLARRRLEGLVGPVGTGVLEAALACVARGSGRVALDGERDLVVSGDDVLMVGRRDDSGGPR